MEDPGGIAIRKTQAVGRLKVENSRALLHLPPGTDDWAQVSVGVKWS